MNSETDGIKRKWPVKRTVAISIVIVLSIAAILLDSNFNRLLADALMKSFNSNIISDVYELKFEKLSVNPFEGSIRVSNVILMPREKPLRDYPYINSTFRLKTDKLMLIKVDLIALLKSNKLNLEKISISKPDVDFMLGAVNYILLPFKDSTNVTSQQGETQKKTIDSFTLEEFKLIDAAFHVFNAGKEREFKIDKLNISLYDLMISQHPGKDIVAFKQVDLSVDGFSGHLQKGAIKHMSIHDYSLKVDSLKIQKTLDTITYHFDDVTTDLNGLDVQTADSIFHLTMQSFRLAYRDKSIKLKGLSFKPNVSNAFLQKKYQYQHTEFSGTVGTLNFVNMNFDSLINHRKIYIDEIALDSVAASIFKDKTKPIDKNRMPVYLGQTVKAIPLPLMIKHVRVTNVDLVNVERKPDSSYAKINVHRATAEVKNITNLSGAKGLSVSADAYIENKAHFKLNLTFDYAKPQFNFDGGIEKLNLPDLNPVIVAYTPAKINKGTLDEIKFSGIAERTAASGTMKFLYHDLEIDLELHEKAKWKSSVVAFAANTVLNSSNPGSADLPPRIVKFHIERDMNKGFVNVIMKSIINGLKETMIMSKENRKAYKDSKHKLKNQH